jgi:prepilin peptidase CpaA
MSPFALLQTGCLVAFALLLVAAAWQDIRSMRISNAVSLGVAAAFGVWICGGMASGKVPPSQLAIAVGCAAAVFCVGAVGFAAGVLGGGDVKLLAASSLFAAPHLLVDFLLVTAVAGGAMGLAMLAGAPIGPAAAVPDGNVTLRGRLRSGLPYGPAIAAGGLWTAAALMMS